MCVISLSKILWRLKVDVERAVVNLVCAYLFVFLRFITLHSQGSGRLIVNVTSLSSLYRV